MSEQVEPIIIVLKDVESMSHFGVIRDWIIRLKSGQEIELSAEVVEQIVRHENEEAGYVKLAKDQSLPLIPRQDICHIIMERDTVLRKAGWRKVEIENGNNSC